MEQAMESANKKASRKKYYEKHKEIISAKNKVIYQNNREELCRKNKEYRDKNKEKLNEKARNSKTKKELFDKPVLIKTLYYPAFAKDTLNSKVVTRDYMLVSVYNKYHKE
jgi:hypothetical protein